MSRLLRTIDLGRRPYGEVLELQRELARRRATGNIPDDVLLLVEHPSVFTLGRGTRAESLPLPVEELRNRGIEVHEVERGGDVTYHGPGQLVGYPILDLQGHRPDLHWYLRQIEGAVISALAELRVVADRNPGFTGVWTEGKKIASIGIHVRHWVTFHGFALNVTTNLDPFGLIVPCGIHGVEMTSVAQELGTSPGAFADLDTRARSEVVAAVGRQFDLTPEFMSYEDLLQTA
ncbi:MAG: lipoyl(octanoyl) transferase LipB [Gemmatimonadota bacterium]